MEYLKEGGWSTWEMRVKVPAVAAVAAFFSSVSICKLVLTTNLGTCRVARTVEIMAGVITPFR